MLASLRRLTICHQARQGYRTSVIGLLGFPNIPIEAPDETLATGYPPMNISPADLAVFVGFFAVVISLSVWKSRRAKGHVEDSSDFFLAGRGLTWPLIGISIVAANISTEQMVGMAGQAAGATGLAVAGWQLLGSVFIVIIAMTLLPRFLRAGIYTMPEFLEYRYNSTARAIMAILTVIIYAVVMLPAVLYSGGVTLKAIAGVDLRVAVWLIGLVGTIYCTFGGLKAIAWADLVQGLALLVGGMLVFFLGLPRSVVGSLSPVTMRTSCTWCFPPTIRTCPGPAWSAGCGL